MWLGEGAAGPVPKPSVKLRRVMGYKASIWLRNPRDSSWSQPHRRLISYHNSLKKRWGGKVRYKAIFLHLFIYVYLLQKKRTGTGSKQAQGCFPRPTPESELVHDKYESALRDRNWELTGREGRSMYMQAFMGGVQYGQRDLCIERPYVQLEAWGRLAQWL